MLAPIKDPMITNILEQRLLFFMYRNKKEYMKRMQCISGENSEIIDLIIDDYIDFRKYFLKELGKLGVSYSFDRQMSVVRQTFLNKHLNEAFFELYRKSRYTKYVEMKEMFNRMEEQEDRAA